MPLSGNRHSEIKSLVSNQAAVSAFVSPACTEKAQRWDLDNQRASRGRAGGGRGDTEEVIFELGFEG